MDSMAKLLSKKRKRILFVVAQGLFVFTAAIASIVGTFAWFALNQTTKATGLSISVEAEDGVDIAMKAYGYDQSTLVGKVSEDYSLSKYDTIFAQRNKYAALVLELEVKGGDIDSTVSLFRDTKIEESGYTTSTLSDSPYISSVLNVKCLISESPLIGTSSWSEEDLKLDKELSSEQRVADQVFKNVSSYFSSGKGAADKGKTFTRVEGDNYVKSDVLTFAVSDYASSSSLSGKSFYVYLYLNYVDSFVRSVSSTSFSVKNAEGFPLAADLTTVYVD